MTKFILSRVTTINRPAAFTIAALLLLSGIETATDGKVVSSGGFAAAYRVLAPIFERTTGNHLVTSWGPSMGNTTDAVPQRIQRNEPIDVVIMVGPALSRLVEQGKVVADSRVDLEILLRAAR
jgi:molybdate transport system substrate-binding protein